ncbi:MAG TPA: hypothetical protein VGL38_02375 [bacterium]|jgi:plastocyanin
MTLFGSTLAAHATIWNVDVADFQFTPSSLTILQGDTVRWTNSLGFHSVTPDCDPALFGTPAQASPWQYVFIFNLPIGSYGYHCEVHPHMMGTITVQDRGTWHVTVQSFSFTPANLTITRGDTVIWSAINGFHNVHHNATPSLFGTAPATAPWTYQFVFSNVGDSTLHYICQVHPTLMQGAITVSEPQALPAPAALTAYPSDTAHIRLTWGSVCGAGSYAVFKSLDASSPVFPDSFATTTDTTLIDSIGSPRAFYLVKALGVAR